MLLWRILVKLTAVFFRLPFFIFTFLIFYMAGLFEFRQSLGDTIGFLYVGLLIWAAWISGAGIAIALQKRRQIYTFYFLLGVFYILDVIIVWFYVK